MDAAAKQYTVLKNLRYQAQSYRPGDAVELNDNDARILLKTRVVKPGAPTKAAPPQQAEK
jgi:hypothetical protein